MYNICIRRVVHFANSLLSLSFLSPQQRVPNNTPATPSQLPDILSSLSQMTTNSESMERSHGQWMDRRERCSSGAELGELMMYQDQSSNQTQSLVVPGMHPELPPQEMSDPQSVYEPSQPPQQQPPVQPYSFYGQAPNVTSSSWVSCVLPPHVAECLLSSILYPRWLCFGIQTRGARPTMNQTLWILQWIFCISLHGSFSYKLRISCFFQLFLSFCLAVWSAYCCDHLLYSSCAHCAVSMY